jgi:thiamine-phosphate pyrophosphorylase
MTGEHLAWRFVDLLQQTRLYAVTDDRLDPGRLLEVVDALLRAGVRLFQYRDKSRPDRERVAIAERLVAGVHGSGGLVLVNDRVDVALAASADGAHLGQDDLPLEIGRVLLGPDRVLGASASYLPEISTAIGAGIDYLGFGAVFSTDTKPDAEFAGLEVLAQASRLATVPVVGIGGIDVDRAPAVVQHGAAGVAVVSALFQAERPEAAARALLKALGSVARVPPRFLRR